MSVSRQAVCASCTANCHFGLNNIPFGVFSITNHAPRVGTAIGNYVMDLSVAFELGIFASVSSLSSNVFQDATVNAFMATGRDTWRAVRKCIQNYLQSDDAELCSSGDPLFVALKDVTMHMPMAVGDYTDFYSSKEHATNVGTMFRGKENALNPNWVHMPIAYHGRSSSVMVSKSAIVRPCGQLKAPDAAAPSFGPTKKLDFELEMAFVVGTGNALGSQIAVDQAEEHIFGVVLMNDWSARDIQAWEYVPLGPFLGKNFGTIISPWIVTLDALQPFMVPSPAQDPHPLPYLASSDNAAYDVHLQVHVEHSVDGVPQKDLLCSSNLKYMYWTFAQQLAHHTCNGCNMRSGDLCGTGTISGPTKDSCGSLLELSDNGKNPLQLASGRQISFLEDGDVVVMTGYCQSSDGSITVGFGDCICPILPARV